MSILGIGVFCITGLVPAASSTPIIQGGTETQAFGLISGAMVGYDFVPIIDLSLVSLGFWDQGSDGLPQSFQIGLWEADSQMLLATVTIDNDDPIDASLVVAGGSWRYEALNAAVPLVNGVAYTVGFHVGGDALSSLDTFIPTFGSVTSSADIAIVDAVREAGPGPSSSLVFPGPAYSGFDRISANANVLVVIPEPGTALLVALGLAALSFVRRPSIG
jgi:hypothetical protein